MVRLMTQPYPSGIGDQELFSSGIQSTDLQRLVRRFWDRELRAWSLIYSLSRCCGFIHLLHVVRHELFTVYAGVQTPHHWNG